MADGLNRVMLIGNLGSDPEFKVTPSGQAVLKLRVATTESYLDRNKLRQERTEWHMVTIWGKRGEALAKYLAKGSRIFVEGGLRTTSFEARDGGKRFKTEIIANNIILISGRSGGAAAGAPAVGSSSAPRRRQADFGADDESLSDSNSYPDADYGGGDDDIPF